MAISIKKIFPLLLFLSFLGITRILAEGPEPLKFRRHSIEAGLSQAVIYDVAADRRGIIWIGTGNGLNQYDGYQYKLFKQQPNNPYSLSDDHIRVLYVDPSDRLWVGTQEGLNCRVLVRDDLGQPAPRFIRFKATPGDSTALQDDNIWSIMEDARGFLWVGTDKSLYRARVATDENGNIQAQFTDFGKRFPEITNTRVSDIVADGDGNLWISTIGQGLFRLGPAEKKLTRFDLQGSIATQNFMDLFWLDESHLVIGTYLYGAVVFDIRTEKAGEMLHPALAGHRIFSMVRDAVGRIWFGCFGEGIKCLDPATGEMVGYTNIDVDRESLSNNYVRNLWVDQSNMLWVATNKGLNLADLKPNKFQHYANNPHQETSLADNVVLSVTEGQLKGKKGVWVGTNSGLDFLDREKGTFEHFKVEHHTRRSSSGFVFALHNDARGQLWLGTFGGGLFRFDPDPSRMRQYVSNPEDPTTLSGQMVYDITEDNQHRLWIATTSGLSCFDPESEKFIRFNPDPADSNSLPSTNLLNLYRDLKGRIWVGTTDGICLINPADMAYLPVPHARAIRQTLAEKRPEVLLMDREDHLWIGTNYGLHSLNLTSGEMAHYYTEDGLSDNAICGLVDDREGNIWVSTLNGLTRISQDGKGRRVFRAYDARDGLNNNEFLSLACYKSPRTGEIFLGGMEGLNIFSPENVYDNLTPPPVLLTAFRKYDRLVYEDLALANLGQIELGPTDRFFSFEFSALDYTVPEKNHYAYQLEGFDADWVTVGTRRFASYTNLDPGEYLFRVKAANADGIWNTEGTSMKLIIHPPFWERWWFQMLVIGGIAALLFSLHRYRMARLLEIERMRVQIASDLHDDVGATLTKISLYSDVLRSGREPEQQAGLLERIGQMSRELVVTMSDIVWSIDARNDHMQDLVDRMQDFAMSVLTAKNIDYFFDVQLKLPQHSLPIEIRQNTYLIFKEAINNAARHSGASRVDIRISLDAGKLLVQVVDNGRGLNGHARRSGHGLENMKMRARRIKGEIVFQNGSGLGVVLTVPVRL